MDALLSDLRRALRVLRTSPGLVAVSVLSLGLGIGVNLTLFTAVRAVFFYEPTLADGDRAVGVEPGNSDQFSYLNYRDLAASGVFERVLGYRGVQLNLRASGDVARVQGLAVTPDFFDAIRVRFAEGRGFGAAEASPERNSRLAVISRTFRRRHFPADDPATGRTLTINGEPFTIVGVLPEGYRPVTLLADPDVYVPVNRSVLPTLDDRRNMNALNVIGWRRSDATPEQAQAALTTFGRALEQRYPIENLEMGRPARIVTVAGREFWESSIRLVAPAALVALFSLVLLSASANVAGLLLARAAQRRREFAVRTALGARRIALMRMLLVESAVLAILGAVAGTLLTMWASSALRVIVVAGKGTATLSLAIDAMTAGYAVLLVVVTSLLCGILPSLRATSSNVVADIQSGDGPGSTGRLRVRHAFVVGQVAVCVILLVLSGLLLRSLLRITAMNPGFDLDRGIVATVNLDASRYAADGGLQTGERIIERLATLPGVESVALANILALGSDSSARLFQLEHGGRARAFVNSVSARYFTTLGVPLVAGRDFDTRDRQGSMPVAIVTEAFARTYFPGRQALGQRIRQGDNEPYAEIVGVVRDHKYESYAEAASPIVYAAYAQRPRVSTQVRPLVVHVRATAISATSVEAVKQAIAQVDSTSATEVETLRVAAGSEPAGRRLGGQLLGAVGALGLLLATIGLYGMMAFVVASRVREIGIRMALGATTARILGGVIGAGLRLVGLGIVVGGAIAWLAARALVGLLAGVSPADPITFLGTAAVLIVVGVLACTVPARRAAHLDPLAALRRL